LNGFLLYREAEGGAKERYDERPRPAIIRR
jgi:hypothetical protein